jgi:hypothetical protein
LPHLVSAGGWAQHGAIGDKPLKGLAQAWPAPARRAHAERQLSPRSPWDRQEAGARSNAYAGQAYSA